MNLSIIGKADGPTSIFLAGRFGNLFMIPAFLIIVFFMESILQNRFPQSARESEPISSDAEKKNLSGSGSLS